MLKQLVSFVLPVTALVIVPWLVEKNFMVQQGATLYAGGLLIGAGLTVMAFTVSAFIRKGRGTLAPWSPTRRLVIRGLYAYVRNPMILGVFVVLLGESLVTMSPRILTWAAAFLLINHVYFVLSEEPGLEKRFGDEYSAYKKSVPRWLPRFTPFQPGQPPADAGPR